MVAGRAAQLWLQAARAVEELERQGRKDEAAVEGAVLRLLSGSTGDAVQRLERAVAVEPTTEALNDLAVAYLTRSMAESDTLDLLRALEVLQLATKREPGKVEVFYNYALTLTYLHLRHLAATAWRRFLTVEPNGAWARRAATLLERVEEESARNRWTELSAHLSKPGTLPSQLVRQVVQDHPWESREHCERTLLFNAIQAARSNDPEKFLAWLDAADQIARAYAESKHDDLLVDEIERLRAVFKSAGLRFEQEVGFVAQYFEGLERYDARDLDTAESLLRSAGEGLEKAGSPLALAASLYAEVSLYYRSSHGAFEALEQLLAATPGRYPELRGRILWMMGIVASSQNRFNEASQLYLEAAALVEETSGQDRSATLELLLADNFDRRGEAVRGWRHRSRALGRLAYQSDPQRRYGALIEAAQALGRNGKEQLALMFLQEAEANLADYPLAYARAEISLERSQNFLRLGQTEKARMHLAVAKEAIMAVADSAFRARLEVIGRLTEGMILLPDDASTALELFQSIEHSLSETGYRVQELPTLLAVAEAKRQTRDSGGLRKTLAKAVKVIEETRRDAREVVESVDSFRRAEAIFDQLILESVKLPDGLSEAFSWAERSRSQTALDFWWGSTEHGGSRVTARELKDQLPRGEILIEFAVVGDAVLCWAFADGEAQMVRLDADRSRLEALADRFRAALIASASSEEIRRLGTELYRTLLGPMDLRLFPGRRLIVVPDGPIGGIPFSALVEPASQQFLVERVTVSVVPSATLFLLARQRASKGEPRLSPLVVGINKLPGGPYADLPALQFAEQETSAISLLFPDAKSLLDTAATRSRVSELLPNFNAFHFSGHALSSERDWNASALLLVPESTRDDGMLRVRDLLRLSLGGLRLVTLSACETLRGYEGGREGTFGLAMGFFSAGVPTVVGSMWKIDDRGSARLMRAFYRHLSESIEPAEALRRAKVESLYDPDPLLGRASSWAAFEIIGV